MTPSTVIGQGSIDTALSLRAEERRGLFEDAAAIRPFQVQRADAENRLKQTEQNLERLRDIVSEIEPRLAPLAEQARRAIEFGQLNAELQEVLCSWYALQWRRLRILREHAESDEQEQSRKVLQVESTLKTLQEQGNTLRAKRHQAQTRISEAGKAYSEANDFVQKIERELAVNEERVVGLERQCNDFQQEERRLRERLIAIQKQNIDLEEQCDLADEALDNGATNLATLEAQVAKAQKDYEMDERRLRGAQSDLVQVQARLGATQTELGRLQKQLGERNRTLAARRDTIAQAQQSLRTIETRLAEERARLDTARNEEQQVAQRKQSIARTIADAQLEMDRLKTTLAEAEHHKRSISDRLNMLKSWRQNLSGYSDGVRTLLRAPDGKLRGLIGPVPQLGVVTAGMELALEAALGPYMQAVVVQTFADARQCLEYLQSTKAGKVMVLWLERTEGNEEPSEISTIQEQVEIAVLQRFLATSPTLATNILGFAWQFVQCEPCYTTLFRRMLRGSVVAHAMHFASELLAWALQLSMSSDTDLPFTSVVTLKGEVLHVDGWLTGGAGKDGAQQGLLAYERELRELPQQLEEQTALINKINGLISEVQRGQEGRRAEQTTIEKELQKVISRINDINKAVGHSQRELDRLQTEIRMAASVEQQLAAEAAGLEQEVQAAQERVRTHEKSQREMTGLVEELQIEMEERATTFRRQQEELGRARTALAVKRQEAKSLRQQLATQQTQAQDLKSQVSQQVARIKDAEQRHETLQKTITEHRSALEVARTCAQELVDHLRVVEKHITEIDQQISAQEQQRIQTQQNLSQQETIYRRLLLESQRARDAAETLLVQLQEELGISDPKELTSRVEGQAEVINRVGGQTDAINRVPTSSPDKSGSVSSKHAGVTNAGETDDLSSQEEAQLKRYRRRIEILRNRLKVMGGCDTNAPQLYEETKTRYDFLSSQITDMDQATSQLHLIIEQLDLTMARQFELTFQAVNTRFREHFTTLFNGGTARLELVAAKSSNEVSPAPSSMPSGVEIIVQPPGKKVQDLSLLSGGERALVSAALLFSLLEINPPPFCLLDEVDAALDKSNVTRFCDILKCLAQQIQFTVITHNRVTMSAAQVIYGTSMRKSVSRMLSLRLEETAVAGDR